MGTAEAEQEIVAAAAHGQDVLEQWIAEHPSNVTESFAESLYRAGEDLLGKGETWAGALRHMASAQLYAKLGNHERSLHATWRYLEGVYMAVDIPAQYAHVRDGAMGAEDDARARGLTRLAFGLAVLGGDCAFWASERTADAGDKATSFLACLGDLKRAADGVVAVSDGGDLERYASLAAGAYFRSLEPQWKARASEIEPLLVSLAAATERLIPTDYAFPTGIEMTRNIAQRLAALSDEYGDPQVGARRRVTAVS